MTQIEHRTQEQEAAAGDRKPRLRFAPSPTGLMHIGGFRTALFSWLYARKTGGSFILRIEDTDQARTVEGAVEFLLEGMAWLGMDIDEGPVVGGAYGPYFQTQRREIYHQYTQQLLDSGHAYKCYCTPERLDEMRKEQMAKKLPPRYDRRCRYLTADERAAHEAAGEKHVIRFATPIDGETTFRDELRGDITFKNADIDDTVILKSDGLPTYHLAHIIDDHFMAITHLVRAEEWISSAPRHILIWRAFGWQEPLIYHAPDVLGNDKRKLSKRHGAPSWKELQQQGFLPEAVLNFLALIGWSLDDKTEFFTREELIQSFTLERVSVAGAIYDAEKLAWMNGVYIRQLSLEEMTRRTIPYMERPAAEGGLPDSIQRPLDVDYTTRVLSLEQERLRTLGEAAEAVSFFYTDDWDYETATLIQKNMDAASTITALQSTYELLESLPTWEHEPMEAAMRELTTRLGLKAGQLFGAVRTAVSGRKATPPLFQMMEVLGRERTQARIQRAIARLR
ncbi:glutamate--tRNA ligase [Tengunoibacter tsumagoiensis]|uniref:Glutamate--tRNA ligase n=1 Tax=Tengunoibacter tsumagoiensis TaxID=2014871 RepID=A0A402AAE0_9CHLR|nr:glutamate--tRNA ligase [Tengunoibacter tsumagoiensis]GCE16133.1 glutamate--tRNA ligase [Tengunoibacter tsumagoiensis]